MPTLSNRTLNLLAFFFATAWALAAVLAPSERTLGTVVRWVYVHASLSQVSLLLFLLAAVMAVAVLVGKDNWRSWMEAFGWMALLLWLAGFLLSMIPAKLSWGVLVDFQEPRTQMTLRVLFAGILIVLVTLWVAQPRFSAVAQIVLSAAILFLTRSTAVVRHPLNPIGQADSPAIPLAYGTIFLLALLASTIAAWRWQRAREQC